MDEQKKIIYINQGKGEKKLSNGNKLFIQAEAKDKDIGEIGECAKEIKHVTCYGNAYLTSEALINLVTQCSNVETLEIKNWCPPIDLGKLLLIKTPNLCTLSLISCRELTITKTENKQNHPELRKLILRNSQCKGISINDILDYIPTLHMINIVGTDIKHEQHPDGWEIVARDTRCPYRLTTDANDKHLGHSRKKNNRRNKQNSTPCPLPQNGRRGWRGRGWKKQVKSKFDSPKHNI